ncbi:DUF1990 family protein [Umezawaea endophytica]|uniref:DUF1990 family protein n=1 Tax=Umezawaea endophytica TaxID=1654476 RepID=A0A9X3AF46_9PSEU|nr:DUF1990 family protein [Umezawaea endophytica]MCS7477781.1 DUF1990 family protein [Umezawaea endophytica]
MTPASGAARLATVLWWPVGLAVVAWRYLWRTTPLHRSDEAGGPEDLPDFDDDVPGGRAQRIADGTGPLLHRTYAIRIVDSPLSAPELVDVVARGLNRASPEMAVFHKTRGSNGSVRLGDELVVRMPGPWDGPVRVTGRDGTSFRLSTLAGHLEAGHIEFRASAADDVLHFEIESWCRAGDRLSHLLYNRVGFAKEVQLNMWTHFCVRTAALAGGRYRGGVTIRTRRVDWPAR